jgi:hypothetical protein
MIINLPVTADAAVLGHIVSVSGSRSARRRSVRIAQSLHAAEAREDRRTVEIDVFGEMNERRLGRNVTLYSYSSTESCRFRDQPPSMPRHRP